MNVTQQFIHTGAVGVLGENINTKTPQNLHQTLTTRMASKQTQTTKRMFMSCPHNARQVGVMHNIQYLINYLNAVQSSTSPICERQHRKNCTHEEIKSR